MWYVSDVLYTVLYVRVSCFVVRGCGVRMAGLPKTVNRAPIVGGGRFRHNLHSSLYPL